MDTAIDAKFAPDAVGRYLRGRLDDVESSAKCLAYQEGDLKALAEAILAKNDVAMPVLTADGAWVEYLRVGKQPGGDLVLNDTIVFHFLYSGGKRLIRLAYDELPESAWPKGVALHEAEIQVRRECKLGFHVDDPVPDVSVARDTGERILLDAWNAANAVISAVAGKSSDLATYRAEARRLVEAGRDKALAFRDYQGRFREGIGLPTTPPASVTRIEDAPSARKAV